MAARVSHRPSILCRAAPGGRPDIGGPAHMRSSKPHVSGPWYVILMVTSPKACRPYACPAPPRPASRHGRTATPHPRPRHRPSLARRVHAAAAAAAAGAPYRATRARTERLGRVRRDAAPRQARLRPAPPSPPNAGVGRGKETPTALVPHSEPYGTPPHPPKAPPTHRPTDPPTHPRGERCPPGPQSAAPRNTALSIGQVSVLERPARARAHLHGALAAGA